MATTWGTVAVGALDNETLRGQQRGIGIFFGTRNWGHHCRRRTMEAIKVITAAAVAGLSPAAAVAWLVSGTGSITCSVRPSSKGTSSGVLAEGNMLRSL